MVNVIKDFAPTSLPNIPNFEMSPEYITVHNTGNTNSGANAEMHNRYLKNGSGGRMASWHFTVDENVIYQHIPTNRSAWHCTDGLNGTGNRKSIGIEICMHRDQKDYKKAEANAIWLINELRNHPEKFEHKSKIKLENIKPHFFFYSKNCPQLILPRWDAFLKEIDNAAKPTVLIQPSEPIEGVHIVSRGETLSAIAAKYNTTVDAFAKLNGITNPNLISVGDRLDIPNSTPNKPVEPVKPTTPTTYTVKAGDSLSAISARYGVSITDITKWNNISNPSLIQIGQVLHLTGQAPKPSTPTTPQPIGNFEVTANLNVRSGAGLSFRVLRTLPNGTRIVALEEKNGFYRIGKDEWVSKQFTRTATTQKRVEIIVNALNVRSDSNLASRIVRTVSKGQRFNVLEEKNGMFRIAVGQWISASKLYVKVV